MESALLRKKLITGETTRDLPRGRLREVTNTMGCAMTENATLQSLLADCAGLERVSERRHPQGLGDDAQLKVLSVLEGLFEAPDFSNHKLFRNAVHRQQLLSRTHPCNGIVYESAWDSVSPGRLKRVYTRHVPDWDELSGKTFHVRWWSQGMRPYAKWDRGLQFWTFEDLQEAHREHSPGTSGPQESDWCHVHGVMDWSMFWSAALLYKTVGSSGVKYWDAQFQAMKKKFLYHSQET